MKEVVLVIFGGKSVEHDISVITAVQTMKSLPKQYVFLPVYVDKSGIWWIADNLQDVDIYKNFSKLAKNKKQVILGRKTLFVEKRSKLVGCYRVSAALNCCHGHFGEDGTLQGLLSACEIACTSCGVTSSALCMDKAFVKDILKANEIASPDYAYFDEKTCEKNLPKNLEFPVIVKPANLGSSIGISVCKDEKEYSDAIELALEFDKKVLVEKLVENLREFNCACFAYKGQKFTSSVNEVQNSGNVYSFEDKYLSSQAKNLDVDKKLGKKIKALTEKVYSLFDCQGVVRVDFLFDNENKILYVNEINTIPGSLAVYLFKGVPAQDIITAMIEECKENFNHSQKLVKTFDSDAIEIYAKFKPVSKK